MNEIRVCENCNHHNSIDNLECEECGFDLSFCVPILEDSIKEQTDISGKFLCSTDGNIRIEITGEMLIGRDGVNAEYFENSRFISRCHATIFCDNDEISVMDASTNGTYINGKRIEKMKKTPLKAGDKITFADMDFVLEG